MFYLGCKRHATGFLTGYAVCALRLGLGRMQRRKPHLTEAKEEDAGSRKTRGSQERNGAFWTKGQVGMDSSQKLTRKSTWIASTSYIWEGVLQVLMMSRNSWDDSSSRSIMSIGP